MSAWTSLRACGADMEGLSGSGGGGDVRQRAYCAGAWTSSHLFGGTARTETSPAARVTMSSRGAKSHLRFCPKKTLTPDRFRLDQDRDSPPAPRVSDPPAGG